MLPQEIEANGDESDKALPINMALNPELLSCAVDEPIDPTGQRSSTTTMPKFCRIQIATN